MTWQAKTESLRNDGSQRAAMLRDGEPVTYGTVIEAWRYDHDFRECLIDLLAASPCNAYYWETPPVSVASLTDPFECVLLDSGLLAGVAADAVAFAEHFDSPSVIDDVVSFRNLGHDAVLIAPCPAADPDAYPHLAAFARLAPRPQQHALWRRVGEELTTVIGTGRPVWVSTAGQGVFWLHVRLDRSPKYYNHAPYRRPCRTGAATS